MRIYLTIFFMLITSKIFACECAEKNVHEKYNESQGVIKAKVLEVYKNTPIENNYYKIDLEVFEIYKGKTTSSILVYGSSDENIRSSCDLYIPKNSIYLFYINKNKNNHLSTHMCSGSVRLDDGYTKNWGRRVKNNLKKAKDLETEIIKFLKNNGKKYPSHIRIYSEKLNDYIEKTKDVEVQNKFAFYEITLKSDLNFKSVNRLKEFDNEEVDKSILNCIISEKNWSLRGNRSINTETTFLLGLFYYPSEDNHKSFISFFTL